MAKCMYVCNEGIFARLIANEAYELHLFDQICTSQVVIMIGRNVFTLHCAVSLMQSERKSDPTDETYITKSKLQHILGEFLYVSKLEKHFARDPKLKKNRY